MVDDLRSPRWRYFPGWWNDRGRVDDLWTAGGTPLPVSSLDGWMQRGFLGAPARQDVPVAMLLLIDNYDSFTYNLYHYLGELGAEVVVHRNDALTAAEAMALAPQAIVISPGPCDPDRAGITLELIREAAGRVPVFGVCLGHQAIAQNFGATVGRAPSAMHGKVSDIHHDGTGVFAGLPSPFRATRYHSLTALPHTMPNSLLVNARSDDGVIMGVRHGDLPIHGVQFHPESIETEHGKRLLKNFLDLAKPVHA